MAEKIIMTEAGLQVPDNPIIPFIEGDGIGPDIWAAAVRVFDAAVEKAYGGKKKIEWKEVLAGEKAFNATGEWLPQETQDVLRDYLVGIKGPLTTPVGGGIRSLNVAIRQILDLYVCQRPVKYYDGVHSPVKQPELIDMVVFRENTEDVYAGFETKADEVKTEKLIDFLKSEFDWSVRAGSGIGIKPVSKEGSQRLIRAAIEYAIAHNRKSVTLVHKGNIMKFTEGAFREWGYELAEEEYVGKVAKEGEEAEGKVIINDRIADAMFQELLMRPDQYSVVATTNLNGDYLSDALAAQVGGLGLAPGVNMGEKLAIYEATHGTAPTIAGKDLANPGSILLSGAMLLENNGMGEAAELIKNAVEKSLAAKRVTIDLAAQISGAEQVGCKEFGEIILSNL